MANGSSNGNGLGWFRQHLGIIVSVMATMTPFVVAQYHFNKLLVKTAIQEYALTYGLTHEREVGELKAKIDDTNEQIRRLQEYIEVNYEPSRKNPPRKP